MTTEKIKGIIKNHSDKYWRHAASQYSQNYGWNPYADNSTVDDSVLSDIYEMRALGLELFSNHPVAKSIIDQAVSHATLSGFTFSCDTGNKNLDDKVEELWKEWAEQWADASQRFTLNQLIDITVRNMLIHGESFGLIVSPSNSPYGIALRGVDPMDVQAAEETAQIRAGIEIDAYGVPKALYVKSGEKYNKKRWRDSDGNLLVLQTMIPSFFNQTHGIVPITAVYNQLLDLSVFVRSEVKTAVNSAQINLLAYYDDPQAKVNGMSSGYVNNGTSEDPILNPILAVDPGKKIALRKGERIEQFKMERPNGMFAPFVTTIKDTICRCFGFDRKYLESDWADSNYTAARLSALQSQAQIAKIHQCVSNTMLKPLTNAFLRSLIAKNLIQADEQTLLKSYNIRSPKMPLLDLQKEIQASVMLIENNLSTKQRECERLIGEDYAQVDQQRSREIKEESFLGLSSPDLPPTTGAITPPGQVGKPPQDGSTRS